MAKISKKSITIAKIVNTVLLLILLLVILRLEFDQGGPDGPGRSDGRLIFRLSPVD